MAVLYFQIMPKVQPIDAFLHTPNFNSFRELVTSYQFSITPDISYKFEKLNDIMAQWQLHPNDAGLKAKVVDLMIDYRQSLFDAPSVVGASGSVYGLLLAFGMMFPNTQIMLLIPPVPLKAKYFVIIFGAFEFFSGLQNSPGDEVAHFAHLGGMLFGFILLKMWKQRRLQ
jgi:hypothetical protein